MRILIFLIVLSFSLYGQGRNTCAEFEGGRNTIQCVKEMVSPWVAIGGGWQTIVRFANIKTDGSEPGLVNLRITPVKRDGSRNLNVIFGQDFLRRWRDRTEWFDDGLRVRMFPNEAVEIELLSAAVCSNWPNGCVELPELHTGSMDIRYTADRPEHLRGLAKSHLDFQYRTSDGTLKWNAIQREEEPSEEWVAVFSETYDKSDWRSTKSTSVAVVHHRRSGIRPPPLRVALSLTDEQGRFVTSRNITLRWGEAMGVTLAELFGDSMFPDKRDFVGTLRVEVANPPGVVSVAVFQTAGGTLSSIVVSPIIKRP